MAAIRQLLGRIEVPTLSLTVVSPAYRATLLPIRWAQVKTALTFLHFVCTSCYITCRRFRYFYGETMGKYGQSYGQKRGHGELVIVKI